MSTQQWAVVHFFEDDTVEVVSTSWVSSEGGKLYSFYPSFKTRSAVANAVINHVQPIPNSKIWPTKYEVRKLGRPQYEKYSEAIDDCKKGLEDSDVGGFSRNILAPTRYRGSSTSPSPPPSPLPAKRKCSDKAKINAELPTQPSISPLKKGGDTGTLIRESLVVLNDFDDSPGPSNMHNNGNSPSIINADSTALTNAAATNLTHSPVQANNVPQVTIAADLPLFRETCQHCGKFAEVPENFFENTTSSIKTLVQGYNTLKHNQELMKGTQELILQKITIANNLAAIPESPSGTSLLRRPVKTLDELTELEENLLEDDYRNRMAFELSLIGGRDLKTAIQNILARLLDDEVAKLFSWVGHKKKRNFSILSLKSVIIDAVRKTAVGSQATEDEIAETSRLWLAQAKFRQQRKEPTTPSTTSTTQ